MNKASIFFLLVLALRGQQVKEIDPVKIGDPNPIIITVTGQEVEPKIVDARFDSTVACLSDIYCFVGSWVAANSGGGVDQIVAVFTPEEREATTRHIRDQPLLVERNQKAFRSTKRWFYLGWIEYSDLRVALLVRQLPDLSVVPYTLPIKLVNNQWRQTNKLATDERGPALLTLVVQDLIKRYASAFE